MANTFIVFNKKSSKKMAIQWAVQWVRGQRGWGGVGFPLIFHFTFDLEHHRYNKVD